MQGFDAITAQNGWAMAATGATIVISGLTILSIIVSQLHKIVAFFDKKEKADDVPVPVTETSPAEKAVASDFDPLADLAATAKQFKPLTEKLGETFGLAQLYQTLTEAKDPHPHITVRELKEAGFLAPAEEGTFSWNNV